MKLPILRLPTRLASLFALTSLLLLLGSAIPAQATPIEVGPTRTTAITLAEINDEEGKHVERPPGFTRMLVVALIIIVLVVFFTLTVWAGRNRAGTKQANEERRHPPTG